MRAPREGTKKTIKKIRKTHGEEVGHVVAERAVVGVLLDRHDLDRVVTRLFCFEVKREEERERR